MLETAKMTSGIVLLGVGLGFYAKQSRALPEGVLRPPGALAENDFLGACIRCGLCVRACELRNGEPDKLLVLRLAEPQEQVATGTPYFVARTGPCEMCEDIPCVPICPTNALDHSLTKIDDARMGLAVLLDQENCLNYLGLRCDVCYRECPLIDKAITLERQHNLRTGKHAVFIPTVHSEACTGCGICERVCILEEAAIKVIPIKLAKGEIGKHYRLGWEEKAKAGQSLIDEHKMIRMPTRLPQGVTLPGSAPLDDAPLVTIPIAPPESGANPGSIDELLQRKPMTGGHDE